MPVDYEEEVERILKRYNIDPNDYKTIREFQAAIRDKIGTLHGPILNAASQYFQKTQFSFPKYNVTRTSYIRQGSPQVRYGIPGMRGLFGYPAAARYVMEQMQA